MKSRSFLILRAACSMAAIVRLSNGSDAVILDCRADLNDAKELLSEVDWTNNGRWTEEEGNVAGELVIAISSFSSMDRIADATDSFTIRSSSLKEVAHTDRTRSAQASSTTSTNLVISDELSRPLYSDNRALVSQIERTLSSRSSHDVMLALNEARLASNHAVDALVIEAFDNWARAETVSM